MSITPIPELERLLDEWEAADYLERPHVEAVLDAALRLDTLRALVNVAKAAEAKAFCPFCGVPTQHESHRTACLLAPLFPDEESGVVQDAQQAVTEQQEANDE